MFNCGTQYGAGGDNGISLHLEFGICGAIDINMPLYYRNIAVELKNKKKMTDCDLEGTSVETKKNFGSALWLVCEPKVQCSSILLSENTHRKRTTEKLYNNLERYLMPGQTCHCWYFFCILINGHLL